MLFNLFARFHRNRQSVKQVENNNVYSAEGNRDANQYDMQQETITFESSEFLDTDFGPSGLRVI